jgi:hypothetical protein
VDVPLLAGATPLRYRVSQRGDGRVFELQEGLQDLRLRDGAGREVPYLLMPPETRTPRWMAGSILPVASTKTTSGLEADLGSRATLDRFRIHGIAAPFLKRLRLEGSGDRSHWTVLAPEATIFDLPDQRLRNVEVEFEPGDYRYLRVTWDDRASARVIRVGEVAARVHDVGGPPPSTAVTVSFSRRSSEPGKSRYRITLPGAHLPVMAIDVEARNPNIYRAASISEPRLSGSTIDPVALGASQLRRAERDGGIAADTSIPMSFPEGPDLDLVIEDGNNPPLSIERVVAKFAPLPWIYFESSDGAPLAATYGNPSLQAPHYDLEASRGGARKMRVAQARWSNDAVEQRRTAESEVAPGGGAPVERKDFRFTRPVGRLPRGLTSLLLDAEVLAHSQSLNDVRLMDEKGNQVPYLVEKRDAPLTLPLRVPPRAARDRTKSIYRLTLPYDSLPSGTELMITTKSRVFERNVALQKPADESHGREAELLETATWRSADPDNDPPPLKFTAPLRGSRTIELLIDEGDNAPLQIASARLQLPSSALRFISNGASLTLVYGNSSVAAPRYDLALLAPRLFGQPSREIPLQSKVADESAASPKIERSVFWAAIVAAVLILLFTLVRLLPGRTTVSGDQNP